MYNSCVTHTPINRNIAAGLFTWFSFDLFHHRRKEKPDVWFTLRYVMARRHVTLVFEVLTAVMMKTQFFWVMSCGFVTSYRRFESSYRIHISVQIA